MPTTISARVRAAVVAAVAVCALLSLAPSPASAGVSRIEWRVIAEINAVRGQHGLAGVENRGMLAAAAGRHSSRLRRSGRLAHSSTQRLARRAGGPVGEVIAWTGNRRPSAASIVRQWMNSPPHRAVLLDGQFRRIGVGVSRGKRGTFVTADFARR